MQFICVVAFSPKYPHTSFFKYSDEGSKNFPKFTTILCFKTILLFGYDLQLYFYKTTPTFA
jgi:hypothetical protein